MAMASGHLRGSLIHSLALFVSTVLSSSLPVSSIPSNQLPLGGRKHGLQQHPVSLERKLNFLPQIKKKKKKSQGKILIGLAWVLC